MAKNQVATLVLIIHWQTVTMSKQTMSKYGIDKISNLEPGTVPYNQEKG
jgi:hypothetical protein